MRHHELRIKSTIRVGFIRGRISKINDRGKGELSGIHLREQTSAAIYRTSEEIPAARIPIEPIQGTSLARQAWNVGVAKKRNGRNKNITFRDGAPKSAPETSGPFLVFHWRYSARQRSNVCFLKNRQKRNMPAVSSRV